jgi:hypothetical protein
MPFLPTRDSMRDPASTLAPPAPKPPVKPASWIRVFLIGAVGLCASAALAYFVLLTGALTPWLAAPFLCGLIPAILLSGVGRPLAPALIVCIAAAPTIGFAMVVDIPAFGRLVDLTGQSAAPDDLNIGAYLAADWRPHAEYRSETKMHQRRGPGGTMTVAPLTPPGWTPEQPVPIWLVGVAFPSGKIGPWHPAHWTIPGAYPRLAGALLESEAPFAARQAAAAHGLVNAADPIFVVHAEDAADAMRSQTLSLARILGAALVLWALATIAAVRLPRSRAARAR